MGMAITNPSSFYNLVQNKVEDAPDTLAGKELKFLREVANQTNLYASSIRGAAGKAKNLVTYPNTNLAGQLKIVANLIGGGLKTKVYFVNLGGFDTHSNQVNTTDTTTGTHANLWKQISDAIKAFTDDLKAMGVSKRVVGMTYSEFGRRIKSNASGGTDHGAAALCLCLEIWSIPLCWVQRQILQLQFKQATMYSCNMIFVRYIVLFLNSFYV
jgi:uncharacterized protein (DUF1501 family)